MTAPATAPQPPHLAQMLGRPLGRATTLEPQAEQQLCGDLGSLTTQVGRLLDVVGHELRDLLGVPHDLPPRRPLPWTLLTERENPAWPMLALSRPPTIAPLPASRIVLHLSTAHLAMNLPQCRVWAQSPDTRDGTEAVLLGLGREHENPEQDITWGALLAAMLTMQTHATMLHTWGVLSALVGLNPGLRLDTGLALRDALNADLQLTQRPAKMAATALWASLGLLHGGLSRPSDPAQVARLALSMRTLPERTSGGPLPELPHLLNLLAAELPALSLGQRRDLAEALSLMRPVDPQEVTTGIMALQQPGQCAVWLRRAGEVQLIVSQAGEDVHAWRWRLPTRGNW